MATTTATLPRRSRGCPVPARDPAPYLYLVPAFLVMAVITFYPLVFQVWMSFHDFGQINFRVRNPVPAEFIGLDNYVRIATSQAPDPELRVRPARPVQPVVGVQQRRRPRRHRRA